MSEVDLGFKLVDPAFSQSLSEHLRKMRYLAGDCEKIYAILDNGSYCKSFEVRDLAADLNIELVDLPPYSPNLNLIERLWEITEVRRTPAASTPFLRVNEKVRNNVSFASSNAFEEAIKNFYRTTWRTLKKKSGSRFAENFQSWA